MDFLRSSICKRISKNNFRAYDSENVIDGSGSTNANGEMKHDSQFWSGKSAMFRLRRSRNCDDRRQKIKGDFFESVRQKFNCKNPKPCPRRLCATESRPSVEGDMSRTVCDEDNVYMKKSDLNFRSKRTSSKLQSVCPIPSPTLCAGRCSNYDDSGSSNTPSYGHGDDEAERQNDSETNYSRPSISKNIQQVNVDELTQPLNDVRREMFSASFLQSEKDKELDPLMSDLQSIPSLTLSDELKNLSHYGWYWGPISRLEAEEKLSNQCDGAFLVRDSSDYRYLLSLSFRSFGKTLHTRIEYFNGLFSFYHQEEGDGSSSIVDLINHSMSCSMAGIFCYSRSQNPSSPSFPVRLTKPISRFTHVRSLQYLCRFVIRQCIRVDHIQSLPLPQKIKVYIEEGHY